MIDRVSRLGALIALAATPATARERASEIDVRPQWAGPEIAIGLFDHGSNFHPLGEKLIFDLPRLPDGEIYEGSEEDGTIDIQLAFRTAPLRFALKPRLSAKAQINTDGRTSFASIGAEWRQHAFRGRVYGQVGIGLTIHDGYRFTPDPFASGLSAAEAQRRHDLYRRRTSFGSQVLFNPNASLGIRLDPRRMVEIAWEHFSHHRWFSEQNPGIDNLGLRLVHTIGPRR